MLLDVKNLSVAVNTMENRKLLVDDVSFRLDEKRIVALVGGSGSGKTTTGLSLMRLLAPELTISRGEILWQGKDIHQLKELYRAQLMYIGHLNGIKDELTPIENLTLSACLAGDDSSGATVQKALEAVGL